MAIHFKGTYTETVVRDVQMRTFWDDETKLSTLEITMPEQKPVKIALTRANARELGHAMTQLANMADK